MKIELAIDERYPFYDYAELAGWDRRLAEVPDEVAARWRRVMAEFQAVQDEMETAWNAGAHIEVNFNETDNCWELRIDGVVQETASRLSAYGPDCPAWLRHDS